MQLETTNDLYNEDGTIKNISGAISFSTKSKLVKGRVNVLDYSLRHENTDCVKAALRGLVKVLKKDIELLEKLADDVENEPDEQ
jgi:hypothetical protein